MKPTPLCLLIALSVTSSAAADAARPNAANLKKVQPSVANAAKMDTLRRDMLPDALAVNAGLVAQVEPVLTCYKDAAKTSASTANMLRAPTSYYEDIRLVVAPGGTVSEVAVTSDVINGEVATCVTSLLAITTFATANTEPLTLSVPLPIM